MTEDTAPQASWWTYVQVYTRPRVIGMVFLGFSAGLPFLLVFSTLSAWLTEADVSRTTIGLFSLVGLMYSIKVLWAPIVDQVWLPAWAVRFGRRRLFMLLAQVGLVAGLLAMAGTDPGTELGLMAFLAVWVAFCSATQDINIDAYRIEAVPAEQSGAMAATYQFGYRMGLLAAGAGTLFLADIYSWQGAYQAMAAAVGVGIVTVLFVREPAVQRVVAERVANQLDRGLTALGGRARLAAWFARAVVGPFLEFFTRMGAAAFVILGLIAVYRLSDITMGIMANPFYLDLGFTKSEIAAVSKVFGVIAGLVGAFAGGLAIARWGQLRPLLAGAILVLVTNLLFVVLALRGPDLDFLIWTIGVDSFAGGFAGTAFIAYLSGLTNAAYTATQYALFSSLFTLFGKMVGAGSGAVVDAAGYPLFFTYSAVLGLPAVLLCVWLVRQQNELAAIGTAKPAD